MDTNCNPGASSYYPMTVGNVWNTEMCTLQGMTVASLDTFRTGTTTSTALEKTTLTNGKEVVKFKNDATIHLRMPDSTYSTTTYSYVGEEGEAILSFNATDDTIGDTVLMTGLSVGKKWKYAGNDCEVVAQEDVTVKAGTYKNAAKVKMTINVGGYTAEVFNWYAKGVGFVKMHSDFAVGSYQQITSNELVSATTK